MKTLRLETNELLRMYGEIAELIELQEDLISKTWELYGKVVNLSAEKIDSIAKKKC